MLFRFVADHLGAHAGTGIRGQRRRQMGGQRLRIEEGTEGAHHRVVGQGPQYQTVLRQPFDRAAESWNRAGGCRLVCPLGDRWPTLIEAAVQPLFAAVATGVVADLELPHGGQPQAAFAQQPTGDPPSGLRDPARQDFPGPVAKGRHGRRECIGGLAIVEERACAIVHHWLNRAGAS